MQQKTIQRLRTYTGGEAPRCPEDPPPSGLSEFELTDLPNPWILPCGESQPTDTFIVTPPPQILFHPYVLTIPDASAGISDFEIVTPLGQTGATLSSKEFHIEFTANLTENISEFIIIRASAVPFPDIFTDFIIQVECE